jgi:two-component sensor histidine kinase
VKLVFRDQQALLELLVQQAQRDQKDQKVHRAFRESKVFKELLAHRVKRALQVLQV